MNLRTGTGGTVEEIIAPFLEAARKFCAALGRLAVTVIEAMRPWANNAYWLLYPAFAFDIQATPRIRRRRERAVRKYLRARRCS